jgi:hypothetical protein
VGDRATDALVSQLAEELDSKPRQCGFESHRGHRGHDCDVSGLGIAPNLHLGSELFLCAAHWLLISATATDVVATAMTDALKSLGAKCTSMCWPPRADADANAEHLRNQLRGGGFSGVAKPTGPKTATPRSSLRCWARVCRPSGTYHPRTVRQHSGITSPLRRDARTVAADDVANLEQTGCGA